MRSWQKLRSYQSRWVLTHGSWCPSEWGMWTQRHPRRTPWKVEFCHQPGSLPSREGGPDLPAPSEGARPCRCPDPRLAASRTTRQRVSLGEATPSVVLCHGGPSKHTPENEERLYLFRKHGACHRNQRPKENCCLETPVCIFLPWGLARAQGTSL